MSLSLAGAALARLLASRAIGGYSVPSDDPAPGSLSVFQSSRVARPQDASGALDLVSLLSSSARSYLDAQKQRMLRPVSEVADMVARQGPAGRYVDPVFQHSQRRCVGLVRALVKAGSVGFVETAAEHVGLFFVVKKAGAQRLIIDARASDRHVLNAHLDRCSQEGDSVMSNFRERPRTLKIGLRYQERVSSDAHSWMVASVFCTARCFRIRSGFFGKTISQKSTCCRFREKPCSYYTFNGFRDDLLSRCDGPLFAGGTC